MSLAAQLCNFTTLTAPELSRTDSPAARERKKGAQQRAEDFIYTLNHAVTCLSLTDFLIAPFFSTVFGWNICGHGHDHGKDGGSHSSGGGSYPSGGGHVHGPGCGHWPTSSSSDATASPSSSTAASTSSSGASATSPAKARTTRTGAGMRRSRASWRGNQPLVETEAQKLKRLMEEGGRKAKGLFSALGSSGEQAAGEASIGQKKIELCDLPGCEIDHSQTSASSTTNPTTSSSSAHFYGSSSSTVPEKLNFRQRLGAWWNELRASPMAYLKKHYPGFKEWAIGEAVGDIGAVPVTLAVQHFTPGVMEGIQRGLEPLIGGLMRRRAERAAERWADKHGIARDAEEVVTRAQELYSYEIRHLPQMVMWTLSSVAINYGVMKTRNPSMELATFAKGKAAGAGITAALVFGTRTLVPDKAHKWDETMGRRVVVPITKKVGRLFGIEEKDVEDYHARQHDDTPRSWTKRVKEHPQSQQEVGA